MNILVISSIYPEPRHYGIANDTMVVHYFTKYWAEQGHRVIVIHPYYNAVKNIRHFSSKYAHKITHQVIDNVIVIYGESQLFIPHSLAPAKWRERRLAKRMRRYLEANFSDFVPDAVSVHFPIVLQNFIPKFLNYEKALAVFHGTDIRILKSEAGCRQSLIEELKQTYKLFLFRSPKLMATGIHCGLDARKSKTIISGLKPCLIAEKNFIEKKIEYLPKSLNILYAGKLVKQKRIDQIIKALFLLNNKFEFHFDLIGEGSELLNLENLVNKLGLKSKVTFYGGMSRDAVSDMMSKADMFIMTSSHETLGLVYLEAMAQGCITVGSKGEGIDGIIINCKNGYLVNPNDVDEIAECIRKVINIDVIEKGKILRNAYSTVMNLTDKSMSEYYYTLLENISH